MKPLLLVISLVFAGLPANLLAAHMQSADPKTGDTQTASALEIEQSVLDDGQPGGLLQHLRTQLEVPSARHIVVQLRDHGLKFQARDRSTVASGVVQATEPIRRCRWQCKTSVIIGAVLIFTGVMAITTEEPSTYRFASWGERHPDAAGAGAVAVGAVVMVYGLTGAKRP